MRSRDGAAEETSQLEQKASAAGSTAVTLAAEAARLRDEVNLLHSEKAQLLQTAADIGDIITAKDAEFRDLLGKIEAAAARLRINTFFSCVHLYGRNACIKSAVINV